MYILDSQIRLLQFRILGQDTVELSCLASYADISSRTFELGTFIPQSTISPNTLYALLPSPQVNIKRQLKGCSIYNSAGYKTITLQILYIQNELQILIQRVQLLKGQTLYYTDAVGWYKNASNNISDLISHNSLSQINEGQYHHLPYMAWQYLAEQDQSLTTNSIVTHSTIVQGEYQVVDYSRTIALEGSNNQINVNMEHTQSLAENVSWSISLPQDIDTSANVQFNSVTAFQLTSSTDNNPPLKVSSTALVNNLNSQYFNGFQSSQFYFTNSTVATASTLQGTQSTQFVLKTSQLPIRMFTASYTSSANVNQIQINSQSEPPLPDTILFPISYNVFLFQPSQTYHLNDIGVHSTFIIDNGLLTQINMQTSQYNTTYSVCLIYSAKETV